MLSVKSESVFTLRKAIVLGLCLLGIIIFSFFQSLVENALISGLMAAAFQLLWLALAAYGLTRLALAWLDELGYDRARLRIIAGLMVFLTIAGILFFYFFFQAQRDIKVYDSSLYWTRLIADRRLIEASIPQYLSALRATLSTEYNHLFILPLMLVSYLTGLDFSGFSISILLIYYIPACFFLTLFALRVNKMTTPRKPGAPSFAFCLCLCVLSVGTLWPVLNGYLDVAGMLLVALMLNVTLHWNVTQWNWKKSLALGALTALLMLARGHYEFYLIGFFVAFLLGPAIRLIATGGNTAKRLGGFLLNLLGSIAAACLLTLLLNPAIFSLLYHRDYTALYSAYKTMTLLENLWDFAKSVGIIWLVVAFAGAVFLLIKRETRALCLKLLVSLAIALLILCAVQDLQVRHYYLILPTLIVFVCAFAEFGMQYAQTQEKPIFVICTLLVCVTNFSLAYIKPLAQYSYMSEPLTPTLHAYPEKNPYYSIAKHVISDISRLIGDETEYVYIVGDGPLTNEMLENAHLPEIDNAAPFLLPMNSVDSRDGFPSQMFMADYVLVNRPYQSNFIQVQQVNFQLYDLLVNDPLTSGYYVQEELYTAEKKRFILLRKTRPTDKAYVDALKTRLEASHPDNPFVYAPNYFLALFEANEDVTFDYNYWIDTMAFTKEESGPTGFRLTDTTAFNTLSFTLSCWKHGLSVVVENQDGVLDKRVAEQGEHVYYSYDITGSDYVAVSIVDTYASLPIEAPLRLTFSHDSLR